MFSESVRILTKAVCSSSKTLVEDDDDQVSLSCRKKYEAVWSCVSVRHKRLNHAFFSKAVKKNLKIASKTNWRRSCRAKMSRVSALADVAEHNTRHLASSAVFLPLTLLMDSCVDVCR